MADERPDASGFPPGTTRGKKMILFGIEDAYFAAVAKELVVRGVELHTIISFRPELLVSDEFSDVQVVDVLKFRRVNSIRQLVDEAPVHVENTFLQITDRVTYLPQSVRLRIGIFRTLLRYWIGFFSRETSIGTAFFICPPHLGYDLVAYYVAKRFGVRTLFIERSLIHNRILLLEDYDKFEKVQTTNGQNESLEQIIAAIDPAVLAASRQASAWSRHSAAINSAILTSRTKKPSSRFRRMRFLSLFSPSKWARVFRRIVAETDQTAFYLVGPTPRYKEPFHLFQYSRRVRRLRALYQALTKPPEPGPYVFFALHLQPERSTCPQGGVFDDQIYAIEMLASVLPQGYRLYVKEHPRQFFPTNLKSRHFRDEAYYARLSALPNVHLLPLETSTATMIKSALATATVTGSAGWESLLAGKPCIVFGVPWYVPCNSCHAVRSMDDCRTAITASLESTEASVQRDLLQYLLYFQDHTIQASNMHRFINSTDDYEALVRNLAHAIATRAEALPEAVTETAARPLENTYATLS
jgi:hypothetical protein